jgi:hypothetical protein
MDDREERDREERIRLRAYRMWEAEGCPEGRADVHWDQATELVAIEDNHRLTLEPVEPPTGLGPTGEPIEPLEAVENTGEFPTMTDQGEQSFPQGDHPLTLPEPHASQDSSEAEAQTKASKRTGNANGGANRARKPSDSAQAAR